MSVGGFCEVVPVSPAPPAHERPLLQIAPMMEVTYRDFRYFMRLLTKRAQLWTEMVVDDTLLHNLEPEKCDRFLSYDPCEHPVVCQLGGSDASKLAAAAQAVERYGYDEVNLNVGCPSDRVSTRGEFGCSLMKRPEHVRDLIKSLRDAVQIPVTVKCRLGVDDQDTAEFTSGFVRTVAESGCTHFYIHARKAWLKGLSPAQNRSIPPLMYRRVLNLCLEFPQLVFSINGGINDLAHARALLGFPGARLAGETDELIAAAWDWPASELGPFPGIPANFHGVMIGRGAMNNPTMFWDADHSIYAGPAPARPPTRRELLDLYCVYLKRVHPPGDTERSVGSVHMAVKPTLGFFAGHSGNKVYRATLDAVMRQKPNRDLGPAHCLELAMKAVEGANPGLLDQQLPRTVAYKPPAKRGDAASVEASAAQAAQALATKGRKRKSGAAQETLAKLARPAEKAPPEDAIAGSGGVADVIAGSNDVSPSHVALKATEMACPC